VLSLIYLHSGATRAGKIAKFSSPLIAKARHRSTRARGLAGSRYLLIYSFIRSLDAEQIRQMVARQTAWRDLRWRK